MLTNASLLDVVEPNEEVDASDVVGIATAAAVNQFMYFDVNQDGIFDFADFGLMHVQASMAASISDSPDVESTNPVAETNIENPTKEATRAEQLRRFFAIENFTRIRASEEFSRIDRPHELP